MSRPSLTSHQREVYKRLSRWSAHTASGWVHSRVIGSAGALEKLVRKGYAQVDTYYGPRGGEHRRYKPITEHHTRAREEPHAPDPD